MSMNINKSLDGLKPEFREKIDALISDIEKEGLNIFVFETTRTKERQALLVKKGFSKTMKSKHIEGLACDFVAKKNGKWSWEISDREVLRTYQRFGELARKHGLTWGGDWKNFVDMPHVEM